MIVSLLFAALHLQSPALSPQDVTQIIRAAFARAIVVDIKVSKSLPKPRRVAADLTDGVRRLATYAHVARPTDRVEVAGASDESYEQAVACEGTALQGVRCQPRNADMVLRMTSLGASSRVSGGLTVRIEVLRSAKDADSHANSYVGEFEFVKKSGGWELVLLPQVIIAR